MSRFFLLFHLLLVLRLRCYAKNIVNTEVYSQVNLKNQLVHVKDAISFINNGLEALNSYIYTIGEPEPRIVQFYNRNGDELMHKTNGSIAGKSQFDVALDEEIKPNGTYTFFCKLTYAFKIAGATKHRRLEDDQLVKFSANVRFFSPYPTQFHKVEYLLKPASLVEITKNPTHATDHQLTFVFFDTKPFAVDRVEAILVNNDPLLVVKSIRRSIDINHYGKIAVKDVVEVGNTGPRFVGPYDNTKNTKAATGWLYTHLPASAENIQFFDILGNSSQTQIYYFFNYATLKFKTRYPLLGGWKTSYTLRYEVPIHEYLFIGNDSYKLQIRALDYVLNDNVIEDASIKILLPEGAEVRKISILNGLTLQEDEYGCPTGLCVFKRQILVLRGRDLFENYVHKLEIDYYFNSMYLLRVPLVISFYLQSGFVLVLLTTYLM